MEILYYSSGSPREVEWQRALVSRPLTSHTILKDVCRSPVGKVEEPLLPLELGITKIKSDWSKAEVVRKA